MSELLTAAQMLGIEQAAIDSGEVTGQELMERAGKGVVEAIFEEWPDLAKTKQHAVILCGPGNNGGDGFVVARLLHAWGWDIDAFLYGDAEKLPPDAKENCRLWQEIGNVQPLAEAPVAGICRPETIIIDAMFGTGLTRPLEGAAYDIQRCVLGLKSTRIKRRALVAIDCPSGLCLDSGRVLQKAHGAAGLYVPMADLTITFQTAKRGHYIADGPIQCGAKRIVDIGLAKRVRDAAQGRSADAIDPMAARDFIQLVGMPNVSGNDYAAGYGPGNLRKRIDLHKYAHGHALVLAGPPAKGGAARLAARAALRVGAGLVSVGCPLRAVDEHANQLNAIMVKAIDGPPGLAEELEDKRINAVCVGPGLGLGKQTHDFVMAALTSDAAVVLDADALSRFKANPQVLFDAIQGKVVLTPHDGEFERLFPDIAKKLRALSKTGPAYSRVDAVKEAAARAGAVIVLKGPDTIIAHPAGLCAVHAAHYNRTAPWLATAGTGDVLAGLITGLLARHFDAMDAAKTAVWLHTKCARKFGPGLIAEDLADLLPAVFRDLGL